MKKKITETITPPQPIPAAQVAEADDQKLQQGRFFTRLDWAAAAITTIITLAVYVFTLAPSVTLEDSGEFIAAAYHLGVPHPPGYPTWTILAWLFAKLLPFGNIAWRMNFLSAICGAFACGLLTLIVSRSADQFLKTLKQLKERLPEEWTNRATAAAGIVAGILYAASPTMWSQSVVAEVYSLNSLILMILVALALAWFYRPEKYNYVYWSAFIFALGLTNHQTVLLYVFGFVFAAFVVRYARGAKLGDWLRPGIELVLSMLFVGAVLIAFYNWLTWKPPRDLVNKYTFLSLFLLLTSGGGYIVARVWGYLLSLKHILLIGVIFLGGIGIYGYMPVSARSNPPMNWGSTDGRIGFERHILRKQYDAIKPSNTFYDYVAQILRFLEETRQQFTFPLMVIGLVSLVFLMDIGVRERFWFIFTTINIVFLGCGMVFLLNSDFDNQTLFTQKVFLTLSHGLFAIWIGYGLVAVMCFLVRWMPGGNPTRWGVISAVVLSSLYMFVRPVDIYGSKGPIYDVAGQRGHEFGYWFGKDIFEPGEDYPPMKKSAFLFGGTDPGRFIPTYMVFVESLAPDSAKFKPGFDHRDKYIVTQNALADGTYLKYIRRHYDATRPKEKDYSWLSKLLGRHKSYPAEPLDILSDDQMNVIYTDYLAEISKMPAEKRATLVNERNGEFSFNGTEAIMELNGRVAKDLFERNKGQREFYIEESFPIQWMYPYLEPYGIIMKINPDPLPTLAREKIDRDMRYWDKYTKRLLTHHGFKHDYIARKAFAKLRASLGGLYLHRRLYPEAEIALKQAVQLAGDSPEANYRLVDCYLKQGKTEAAIQVLEDYQKADPGSKGLGDYLDSLKKGLEVKKKAETMEAELKKNPGNFELQWQLAEAYSEMGPSSNAFKAVELVYSKLNQLDATKARKLAGFYARLGKADRVLAILEYCQILNPNDPDLYYDRAFTLAYMNQKYAALTNLAMSVRLKPENQQKAYSDPVLRDYMTVLEKGAKNFSSSAAPKSPSAAPKR